MLEDQATIEKAGKLIAELSGKKDALSHNQLSRWVATKEAHATNIQKVIAEYFMAQRIKATAKNYETQLVSAHTVIVAAIGAFSLYRLPIDAVPDVTNRQVQISTFAPTLGPVDIEKQVTFPVETALAGIPGLEMTRSFSRNGFSQVTAVFTDDTNIYFARQQVNERLQAQ